MQGHDLVPLAAESLLHGLVAAAAIELLIARVPILEPRVRLQLRLGALALPLVLPLVLATLAPWRHTPRFEPYALFTSGRWARATPWDGAPIDVRRLALAAGAIPAVWLLVRDTATSARHAMSRQAVVDAVALREPVAALGSRLGLRRVPETRATPEAHVMLRCTGVRRPILLVSRGALDRLAPDELDAALAHELAHLARHDVARGWMVLAVRFALWFNPAAQIVARHLVQDVEMAADDLAVAAGADPVALAGALVTGALQNDDRSGPIARARARAIEHRARRLLDAGLPTAPPTSVPRGFVPMATVALTALLFLVA